ncbi:MAG: hypothetical protein FMNOHCHN_03603 [Ignavibacteriaceae bacterium]|nr:hypothetical protein [Ignavibacteriaceae bacterium]GIL17943.1 MAG: hypothetical protein BroJett040_16940 [Oligoflexia bacterium]
MIRFLVFLFCCVGASLARAYPELTRFQYNNCAACHVAPSGGGLLTSYGRGLSSEVLSTWGTEQEAGFLHGAVDRETIEKYLLFGGDIRAVQVHKEDARARVGKFIKMQADLAVGWVRDFYAFVINIGELENQDDWRPNGTSYYAMLKPKDELSLRVGRFTPQYGLYLPDHILFVRSFLGFGLGSNRDTAEIQWTGENFTGNVSQSRQVNVADPESATSAQVQSYLFDSSKVALNYWKGNSTGVNRSAYGFWTVLGFKQNLYLLSEFDWQKKTIAGSDTNGTAHYNKLGYTVMKGLDLFIHEEAQQTDLNDPQSVVTRKGLGIQFYPRPHFEVNGVWTKQVVQSLTNEEGDYAWLIFHYYL